MTRFVFSLTEKQADALIDLGVAMEGYVKESHSVMKATLAIEEQKQNQLRPWERCENCNGSGWIEDGTAPTHKEGK